MANVAEIYLKGSDDKTLILNTRCQMIYPFVAPNWVDLRVGFFVSLTDVTNDDLTTGLSETIDNGTQNPPQDYWYLGVKTNNDALPLDANTSFIGYTNATGNSRLGSDLVSSDEAVGTSNTNYWRPRPILNGSGQNSFSAAIIDGGSLVAPAFINVNPHMAQDASGAGGYASLLMLRITRPNSSSTTLTVSIFAGSHTSNVLQTDTPTLDLLEDNLGGYPGTVQSRTASRITHVPDALYAYWPFLGSRLRIHALGFTKFR